MSGSITAYNWSFPIDGDWSDASDWSTGTVPDGATAQVTIAVPQLSTTGNVDVGPIVAIENGQSFAVGSVTVAGSDSGSPNTAIINTLDIYGTLAAAQGVTAGNDGNVRLLGGTLDGSVAINSAYVGGELQGFGTVNGDIDIPVGYGTVDANNRDATPATSSTLTINGSIDNGGYIVVDNVQTASSPETMVVNGNVTGAGGSIELGYQGGSSFSGAGEPVTLEVNGGVGSGQFVLFGGSHSTLLLQDPSAFQAKIVTFEADGTDTGNGIELANEVASSLTATFVDDPNASSDGYSGTLVITDGSTNIADLKFFGDYKSSDFSLTQVGDDTLISLVCYAPGTLIATPDGEKPIEQLRTGDLVSLANGDARPVRWVGRRRVDCRHHPAPRTVLPVRVRRDAFGAGLPRRDLILSPQHAVYFDGSLFPVITLVNGTSVVQEAADMQVYLHVELDHHGILLAEGLPAESYLDTGNRSMFANAALARPSGVVSEPCAPMIFDGPSLEALRDRLRDNLAFPRAAVA